MPKDSKDKKDKNQKTQDTAQNAENAENAQDTEKKKGGLLNWFKNLSPMGKGLVLVGAIFALMNPIALGAAALGGLGFGGYKLGKKIREKYEENKATKEAYKEEKKDFKTEKDNAREEVKQGKKDMDKIVDTWQKDTIEQLKNTSDIIKEEGVNTIKRNNMQALTKGLVMDENAIKDMSPKELETALNERVSELNKAIRGLEANPERTLKGNGHLNIKLGELQNTRKELSSIKDKVHETVKSQDKILDEQIKGVEKDAEKTNKQNDKIYKQAKDNIDKTYDQAKGDIKKGRADFESFKEQLNSVKPGLREIKEQKGNEVTAKAGNADHMKAKQEAQRKSTDLG
ncbi:MAG: hypothetical protein J0H68_05640 [Sphingobacteriia bacterium]|nr:hypothetical protein [Sphingobacteriia bacterium]